MSKDIKFKLTAESKINAFGVKLFRIEATVDIKSRGVSKGDKGGWLSSEKLDNGNARVSGNAWVYGDAEVYGDARVYGNARVSLKKAYTKGNFLYSSDNQIKTEIIDQSKDDNFDGSEDYKYLLVVGDYEINDIDPPKNNEKENLLSKADELIAKAEELKEQAEKL